MHRKAGKRKQKTEGIKTETTVRKKKKKRKGGGLKSSHM